MTFSHHEAEIAVFHPVSATTPERTVLVRHGYMMPSGLPPDIGRMCLDPCTNILWLATIAAVRGETDADRKEKAERRKAKRALDQEAAAAKSLRTSR